MTPDDLERLRAMAARQARRSHNGSRRNTANLDHPTQNVELCPHPDCVLVRAEVSSPASQLETALRLAKEATNGWACYAKRQIEHEDIARLHRELERLRAEVSSPASQKDKEKGHRDGGPEGRPTPDFGPVQSSTMSISRSEWYAVKDSLGLLVALFVYEGQATLFALEFEGATVERLAEVSSPAKPQQEQLIELAKKWRLIGVGYAGFYLTPQARILTQCAEELEAVLAEGAVSAAPPALEQLKELDKAVGLLPRYGNSVGLSAVYLVALSDVLLLIRKAADMARLRAPREEQK